MSDEKKSSLPAKDALILLADDDADALNIVKLGVSTMGYATIEASDGQEALQRFEEASPDLVVLDLMMPGLSGSQVCERIKASKLGKHVPVLILTACEGLREKVNALDTGADDYLTKPFHVEELQARVRALLRVRELNLQLWEQHRTVVEMQERLIQQERSLLVGQLAGTAAHQLGQPLSAIMLNCHLLERLPSEDERFKHALSAIKSDAQRMAELIEQLRNADPKKRENYFGQTEILNLKKEEA